MDNLVSVKQAASSVMDFLLIPSVFVLLIYLAKFYQESHKDPYVFPLEAIVGSVVSVVIALYSFNAQLKSSVSIHGLIYNDRTAQSITVSNTSNKEVNIRLTALSSENNLQINDFAQIPANRILNISFDLDKAFKDNLIHDLTYIKFNFDTPAKNISVTAIQMDKEDRIKEKVNVNVSPQ